MEYTTYIYFISIVVYVISHIIHEFGHYISAYTFKLNPKFVYLGIDLPLCVRHNITINTKII